MTLRTKRRAKSKSSPSVDGSGAETQRHILRVAGALFANKGYSQTSTTEIAAQVGIRQPSLYHHFKSKEMILHAIVADIMRRPLDMAQQIEREDGPVAARLYRLVDHNAMCIVTSPYNISQVVHMPELESEEFDDFRTERDILIKKYVGFIEAGTAEGVFLDLPPKMAAMNLNAHIESLQYWGKLPRGVTGDDAAAFLADNAMRGLLKNPDHLDRIKQKAGRQIPE